MEMKRNSFRPQSAKKSKQLPPKTHWSGFSQLFPGLSKGQLEILQLLAEALKEVRPLTPQKMRELPEDIAELSTILTRDRAALRIPYWSRPSFLSAYLYYFLPWNIIRLARLFSGLELPPPEMRHGRIPVLLDAGSGPLAVPLALWIAKPQWRALPLQVLALDISPQPVELGRKLFASLARLCGSKAWQTNIASGSVEHLARHYSALGTKKVHGCDKLGADSPVEFYPWLATAANVLNEILCKNPDRTKNDETDKQPSILARLLESWMPLWSDGTQPLALFVEPGTRYGGTSIMRLRKAALEMGFTALAPCVNNERCPLLLPPKRGFSQPGSWCHFTFSSDGAPEWMCKISIEAGLGKAALSLSPLLLGGQKAPQVANARVLSQPFKVGSVMARYACSTSGLALLENAAILPSGALVNAKGTGRRDAKSGANIMIPASIRESG